MSENTTETVTDTDTAVEEDTAAQESTDATTTTDKPEPARPDPEPAGKSDTDAPTGKDEKDNDGKDWQKETEKWKALARKHETNAKTNADAAKRLKDIEDAKKSAEEKLNDQLTAAQVELQELKVEKVRAEAVRAAGLDADLAEYITAADPDEAAEQAKRLADRLKPKAAKLEQGARTTAKPAADPDDWLRRMAGRG